MCKVESGKIRMGVDGRKGEEQPCEGNVFIIIYIWGN